MAEVQMWSIKQFNKNLVWDCYATPQVEVMWIVMEWVIMKIISFLLLSSISINAVSATLAEKIRTQNPEQLDQIAKQAADSIAAELPMRINKDSTITSVMKNTKHSCTFKL